jgi:hypothetical protein
MNAKRQWDTRYASAKRRVQQQRAKEMVEGYQNFGDGEVPPPSALAGRRRRDEEREEKHGRSWGMSLWSLWGSKHDKNTMVREQQTDKQLETTVATGLDGANARPLHDTKTKQGKAMEQHAQSRSKSRRRTVTDEHQTDHYDITDDEISAAELLKINAAKGNETYNEHLAPDFVAKEARKSNPAESSADEITTNTVLESIQPAIPAAIASSSTAQPPTIDTTNPRRPKISGIAIPFSLKRSIDKSSRPVSSVSMATLTSSLGIPPAEDVRDTADVEPSIAANTQ